MVYDRGPFGLIVEREWMTGIEEEMKSLTKWIVTEGRNRNTRLGLSEDKIASIVSRLFGW